MSVYSGPEISNEGLVLCLDAGNKKSYSQNEFPYSTDLYSWVTTGQRVILSRDTIPSPVGNTPLKMEITGNDPYTNSYNSLTWNIAPASNGQKWIVSTYIKGSVDTTAELFLFGSDSSGGVGSYYTITAKTVNVSTEWTRVFHTITMNNASISSIQVRLDGKHVDGAGTTIWWDGLQVERVDSSVTEPSPFTPFYGNGNWSDLTNLNNATLNNFPTYTQDVNGALTFDGSNDSATIPYSESLKPDTSMTIESFCRIRPNGGVWASFIQYPFSSVSHTSPYFEWGIYFRLDTPRIHTRINGTGADSPNNVWNFNEWYQIALTFENQLVTFYVNGENVGTDTVPHTSIVYESNNPVLIGKNASGSELFEGDIASLKLYNRALSDSEIRQSFNALRGRFGI